MPTHTAIPTTTARRPLRANTANAEVQVHAVPPLATSVTIPAIAVQTAATVPRVRILPPVLPHTRPRIGITLIRVRVVIVDVDVAIALPLAAAVIVGTAAGRAISVSTGTVVVILAPVVAVAALIVAAGNVAMVAAWAAEDVVVKRVQAVVGLAAVSGGRMLVGKGECSTFSTRLTYHYSHETAMVLVPRGIAPNVPVNRKCRKCLHLMSKGNSESGVRQSSDAKQ